MNLSIALGLCQAFEGFRSKPYVDPGTGAEPITIGYGSTFYSNKTKVTLQDAPISEVDARALLLHELQYTYTPGVLRLCPGLVTDERRLNAIVDFCYNLGVGRLQTSTLRRKINECNWLAAEAELNKWVRGGGKILPGLVKRRQAEALLLR